MRASILVTLGLTIPLIAAAQQRDTAALAPAPGRTIIGVIADSSDKPIDSAEVFLPALKRKTTADAEGRFRFDDVKPGTYQVAARRLGFYPQTREVMVSKELGGAARFALVPYARALPPVVSSSSRGGLSGVIGDTAWGAVKGAEVTIVSTTRRAISDSIGGFFIDLQPGKHMIRVKREGYASQLLTVNVPKDSGRRVMVFLKPSLRDESIQEEIAITDLESRLARRNAVYSTLYTREDINKVGWEELSEIATAGAGRFVDPGCVAVVDGGPRTEFIWALRASEIEGVEIYRARPVRVQVRSVVGGGRAVGGMGPGTGRVIMRQPSVSIPQAAGTCQDEVYVWLRK
jgi:hypothetical protein